MKLTAEQIEYLESNIEMEGLRIMGASHSVKVDVHGCIAGYLRGTIRGNVWGTEKGEEVI